MNNKIQIFDGSNYFNKESFEQLCKLLETGTKVRLYINCIGFTRANGEGYRYLRALRDKYGNQLVIETIEQPYYDEHIFNLKEKTNALSIRN